MTKFNIDNIPNQTHDVCIIGSGMCGQIIANVLSENKKNIIIIESGKFKFDEEIQRLNNFNSKGLSLRYNPNQNLNNLIIRQFGGSANNWGNQIMFYDEIDFKNRPWVDDNLKWEFNYDELLNYYNKTLNLVFNKSEANINKFSKNLTNKINSNFDNSFFLDKNFNFPISFHPQGVEKFNYKSSFSKKLLNKKNVIILTNTTATNFYFSNSKDKINKLEVNSNNKKILIKSKIFILCAGAIENAKILLNNSLNNKVLDNPLIGKYFMDHPRINIGSIILKKNIELSTLLGFKGKNLNFRRGIRFSENLQKEKKILNSHLFINPLFEAHEVETFNKTLQIIKNLKYFKKINSNSFKKFNFQKFIDQLYFIPHRISNPYLNYVLSNFYLLTKRNFSFKKLSLDYHGEQSPNIESKVYLDNSKDKFNQHILNINWKLKDIDYRSFQIFSDYFKNYRNDMFEFHENNNYQIIDQNHRIGTTRMGESKATGVVDKNCKVFDIDNLYISGGSVFRTGSSANPGLTMMAVSFRLAEHLSKL